LPDGCHDIRSQWCCTIVSLSLCLVPAIGYDFYAPQRSVCFHHYSVGKNAVLRNKVHHFWENDNKYAGTGKRAMQRLLGIVHMNPEVDPSLWDHTEQDVYGLGGVRTPERFYKTYGIDVVRKTSEGHLCHFVDMDGKQGPLHSLFTKHLRKDGMGIDYSQFKYAWKDPDGVQVPADPDEEEEEEEEGGEEKEGDDTSD
jgi:Glycosyltransferase (GlcNAc)